MRHQYAKGPQPDRVRKQASLAQSENHDSRCLPSTKVERVAEPRETGWRLGCPQAAPRVAPQRSGPPTVPQGPAAGPYPPVRRPRRRPLLLPLALGVSLNRSMFRPRGFCTCLPALEHCVPRCWHGLSLSLRSWCLGVTSSEKSCPVPRKLAPAWSLSIKLILLHFTPGTCLSLKGSCFYCVTLLKKNYFF